MEAAPSTRRSPVRGLVEGAAQKVVRLAQLLSLVGASRGLWVPIKAARTHTLPAARAFVEAGGELSSRHTSYHAFEGPAGIDYRGLQFIRSLVDAGHDIVASDDELIVTVAPELKAHVPIRLAYAGLGMIDERFVRKEFAAFDVRDAVVIDVGANIGDTALYFIAQGAYRVLAYEPFAETADVAARNISANGIGERVELHRVGIAGARASRFAGYDPLQPHLASTASSAGLQKGAEVNLIALTEAVDRARSVAGVDHPIVLKVDCEGCEGEIFTEDLRDLDGVTTAIVETHSDRLKGQVAARLEAMGFKTRITSEVPALSTAVIVSGRGGAGKA